MLTADRRWSLQYPLSWRNDQVKWPQATSTTTWWCLFFFLVKLDHSPPNRGKNSNIFETTTSPSSVMFCQCAWSSDFRGTMIIAPFFGALRTPRNEEGATFAIHFRAVWQPQMHNPNVIPLGWWLELRKAWSRCQCTTGTCISVAPSFRHITWLYCFATTTAAIHEAITHGTNLSREPV